MEKLKQVLNSPLGRRKNGMSSRKVFGTSLENLMKVQTSQLNVPDDGGYLYSLNVPFVVDRICRHIFANGIEEEGIFRVNGNARVIEKLRDSFEKHGNADLESAEDIFAVAGLLKQFLRDLPEAVIPEQLTSQFVKCQEGSMCTKDQLGTFYGLQTINILRRKLPQFTVSQVQTFVNAVVATKSDKGQFTQQLTLLLEQLSKAHYDLLKYISRFLVDVAAKDSNRMSPMGLAIVFGPNLFRCSAGIEGLRDQGVINEIVCKFISDYASLFGELTEPGPFTIPYIHQNREKRKPAPIRPPPPKLGDSNPTGSLPMEVSEDLRPTTSLSQEFMERASPFTIADGDGHSSIASPVLSAVASELVTKTISEAVLEHIFSEKEVMSIFDNWGETDDMSSRNSTPHSSVHYRRHTPSTAQSSHETVESSSLAPASASTPQPRPRSTPGPAENVPGPQPKPRTHKQSQRNNNSLTVDENEQTEAPKPKPRTKSAPARPRPLGEVLHHSIDIPIINADTREITNGNESNTAHLVTSKEAVDDGDEFDNIAASVIKLQHFKKPKGPAKKVLSRKHESSPPHKMVRLKDKEGPSQNRKLNVSDVNNNENSNTCSPSSDVAQVVLSPVTSTPNAAAPTINNMSGDESPPANAPEGINNSMDMLDITIGDGLLAASPHGGNLVDGLTPEPKHQHRNTAEDEQRAAQVKALNKKITSLKKKVKSFEEGFEAEHGHKPSTQEKNAKVDIKKTLLELSKCRKDLKNLKEQGPSSARVDSAEPSVPINEQDGSRPESVVNIGTSSEPPTMADTLELLLKKLKDKRQEANRADDLNTLTRDQVQEEKLAVQKALLHFESIHGRPQTKTEKELMRPLYDRYRQIKKALATAPLSKSEKKPSEQPAPDAAVVETENGDMLVTQHPDMNQHSAAVEEEDRVETPVDEKTDRETNLQVLSVSELKSELDKANNVKKKLRKLLRDFEEDFQKENNRKVQKDDRGPMDSKYQEYKQIKAKIKLLEVLQSKHEST